MASFDWKTFFRQHGVEYVTSGPNTPRGDIGIRCPMCGPADPSQHMCVSLKGAGWHCWRNASHKGRSRARLIQLVLRCSAETANELAGGESTELLPDDDLPQTLRAKLLGEVIKAAPKSLSIPKEFKALTGGVLSKPFWEYLDGRGYSPRQTVWLAETYGLHYALKGPFAYRIIVPVRDRSRRLQTWTGRSIIPGEEQRYKALGAELALCSIRETLLGLDVLWHAPSPKALLVCEGPFDALWINTFGHPFGVYATCLFGLSMSDSQASMLASLRERFGYVGLLLDSAASFQAFRLATNGLNLDVVSLPETVKDPALLAVNDVIDLCVSVAERGS